MWNPIRAKRLASLALMGACPPAAAFLGGCDAAAIAFESTELGKPLPSADRLPKEARRTPHGLTYCWGEEYMPMVGELPCGELAHTKGYEFRALADEQGRAVCKSYAVQDEHGYGWYWTRVSRTILEVEVPEDWYHEPAGNWPGSPEAAALQRALGGLWKRFTPDRGSAASTQPAGDKVTSQQQSAVCLAWLLERVEQAMASENLASWHPLERHIANYVVLACGAMSLLPRDEPPCRWAHPPALHGLPGEMWTPGAFTGATRTGHNWEQNDQIGDGHCRVQNVGNRRIRIEVRDNTEADSPFESLRSPVRRRPSLAREAGSSTRPASSPGL